MDDLTRRADLKVDTTIAVHSYDLNLQTMGNPRKNKDKKNEEPASKARETPRREEATVRAGEGEELSTSQVEDAPVHAGVSGDDDGSTQQLSKPFTDQQDEQIAAFYGRHPMFYDVTHPDYKNKKKRDFVTKEFAQSLFPSGKCFLSFKYIFHKRVSLTSTCQISNENFHCFLMPNVYKSKLLGYVVCVLRNLHVWTFFLNFAIMTLKIQKNCNELPPPPSFHTYFS